MVGPPPGAGEGIVCDDTLESAAMLDRPLMGPAQGQVFRPLASPPDLPLRDPWCAASVPVGERRQPPCPNPRPRLRLRGPASLVAADVSPLHLNSQEVRADSRRRLRFKGSMRDSRIVEASPERAAGGSPAGQRRDSAGGDAGSTLEFTLQRVRGSRWNQVHRPILKNVLRNFRMNGAWMDRRLNGAWAGLSSEAGDPE